MQGWQQQQRGHGTFDMLNKAAMHSLHVPAQN
jgi:hypothetical protein